MVFQGSLLKMVSVFNSPVDYYIGTGNDKIHVNSIIGKNLSLIYLNEINCIRCGRKTSKSFHQGYCYPCFMTAPETDDCILKPEMCRAHEGISRDMEWSKENCLQEHYVYLAVSSGLKVGVTRKSQIPTRWIDQGANSAIKIALAPNRYIAGLIEVDLKKYFSDKTNWRIMLSDKMDGTINLVDEKKRALNSVKKEFAPYFTEDTEIHTIQYPVISFPQKLKSFGFDTNNELVGKLSGIKGQYLIFEDGSVFNVRKHNGYKIELRY